LADYLVKSINIHLAAVTNGRVRDLVKAPGRARTLIGFGYNGYLGKVRLG